MNLRRTGIFLVGLLAVAGLSACANVAYPLAEPSIMQNIGAFISRSYESHQCEKSSERSLGCSTSAIRKREERKQEKLDAKRVAQGELIPVEQLPDSLYREAQSSVPAVPDPPKIDQDLEPSVVIKRDLTYK